MVNGLGAAEVVGYLSFILQRWNTLPDVTIFLHAIPESHNPDILQHLHHVVAGDDNDDDHHHHHNSPWTLEQIGFLQLNDEIIVCRDARGDHSRGTWELQWELLGFDPQQLPGRIKVPCCAQFMVTKDRILLRSQTFYQQALKVAYELHDAHFFEHYWHLFWGEPAILPDDRELRTYFNSHWTKPVHDAVLHNPYINQLYRSESMKRWQEQYLANPETYYPVRNLSTSVCPTGTHYCYEMSCHKYLDEKKLLLNQSKSR
jgi:hypothetical protein